MLSPYRREYLLNESLARNILVYEGKRIEMPEKFLPDDGFLRAHREGVFRG